MNIGSGLQKKRGGLKKNRGYLKSDTCQLLKFPFAENDPIQKKYWREMNIRVLLYK